MLDTINETHWIIDAVLLGRRDLLVVEPRRFFRGVYCDAMRWEDLEEIKADDDPTRPQSNTIAASLFWDPLLGRDFLILLKDSGTLEILDSELHCVDLFETGIEQTVGKRILVADEISGKVFINLSDNAIYSLDIRRKGDHIHFVKDSTSPKCIYQSPGQILFYEATWHVDLEAGGDFMTIAVLVNTYVQPGVSFEVVRQSQENLRKKRIEWDSVIELTHLDNLEPSSNAFEVTAGMKTVPNMGFFLFASNCLIFFQLPCGSQHTINGSRVIEFIKYNDLKLDATDDTQQEAWDLQPRGFLKQNSKGLEFTLFSYGRYAFTVHLDLIFEHPDEYTYEWDYPRVRRSVIMPVEAADGFSPRVMNVVAVNASTVLAWTRKTGIAFIDLATMSQIHSLPFSQPSALYVGTVGYDCDKLVSCSGFDGGMGYIEVQSYGYETLLVPKGDKIYLNQRIVDAWLLTDELWFSSERGLLMRKDTNDESNQITSFNTKIDQRVTSADSVLMSRSIWNDEGGNFVSLVNDGVVKWSMNSHSVKVTSNRIPLDAQLHLACVKKAEGSYFTVLSIEDRIIILDNEVKVMTKNLGPSWQAFTSCDFFIVPTQDLRYMLIGTTDGHIKLFNLKTLRVEETLRVSSKKIRFCGIPHSSFVLAYTEEDLLLIEIDLEGRCNVTAVSFKSRINFMIARNNQEIYVFEKEGFLSTFEILPAMKGPAKISGGWLVASHCPRKFISFECSNRLIVAGTMRSSYNASQCRHSYSACLLLFDIDCQEQLYSYDLSERYPQATISDIIAIPYQRSTMSEAPLRKDLLYANQLTLSRCFLVALNYENAEDETLDNLLLFSVDDNNCTLDFHSSHKIQWAITALGNFDSNMIIVSGEFLQIFSVVYLVQEDSFRVSQVSNSLPNLGYPLKILGKIFDLDMLDTEKDQRCRTIFVVNLLEGLQEFCISPTRANDLQSSGKPAYYQINPLPGSRKKVQFFINSMGNNRLLVDCSWSFHDRALWIAVAYSDCCLEICCIENNDEVEREIKMANVKLDSEVTSITTFGGNNPSHPTISASSSRILSLSRTGNVPLFCISTVRGGIYTLSEPYLRIWMDDKVMNEAEEYV